MVLLDKFTLDFREAEYGLYELFKNGSHPERVIITDDPLRAKMLAAHHLEHAALMYEQEDELVYFGEYGRTALALVAAGFDVGAVPDFIKETREFGFKEIIYIGACKGTTAKYALRTVILAPGGSRRLLNLARETARQYNIPVVMMPALPDVGGEEINNGVIDGVTAALYEQARIGGADALSILTVSENTATGEEMEEHELRSRFYAAARLVFETFASAPNGKGGTVS